MDDFPDFMKSSINRIAEASQYTDDIEGYIFDGADGSQAAFWKCFKDRASEEHAHDYDEYIIVAQGKYTLVVDNNKIPLVAGEEFHIPKGVAHGGEALAGTRTIHVFGGKRAKRENEL